MIRCDFAYTVAERRRCLEPATRRIGRLWVRYGVRDWRPDVRIVRSVPDSRFRTYERVRALCSCHAPQASGAFRTVTEREWSERWELEGWLRDLVRAVDESLDRLEFEPSERPFYVDDVANARGTLRALESVRDGVVRELVWRVWNAHRRLRKEEKERGTDFK